MSAQLISAIGGAFIGAILTAISAWWIHRSQQVSTLREELRNVILALLRIEEDGRELSSLSDPEERDWWSEQLGAKRVLYVDAAEALVNQIRSGVFGEDVSSVEYGVLADESWYDSDFSRAEAHARRAIKTSHSKARKVAAYRRLADFYFRSSPMKDFDAGRRNYQEAVDLMNGASDDDSLITQAYTYQRWGLDELASGFEVEGREKIDLARKCFRSMSAELANFTDERLESLDLAVQKRLRERRGQATAESSEDSEQNTD
jgi:hypothetical protein